jgi:hypothetical protein
MAENVGACMLSGGLLGGTRLKSIVVLRKPIDRFVSSLYFWSCERKTYPEAQQMLLETPPRNMTMRHIAFVLENGRIDVDEPLRVLRCASVKGEAFFFVYYKIYMYLCVNICELIFCLFIYLFTSTPIHIIYFLIIKSRRFPFRSAHADKGRPV